jgi:hypothetical protein
MIASVYLNHVIQKKTSMVGVLRQRLKRKARITRFGVSGLAAESVSAA